MMKIFRCVCCIRNHRRDRANTDPDGSENGIVESPEVVVAGDDDSRESSVGPTGSVWGKVSSSIYRQASRWSSYRNKNAMRDSDEAIRRFDQYMSIGSTVDEFVQDEDAGGGPVDLDMV